MDVQSEVGKASSGLLGNLATFEARLSQPSPASKPIWS